MQQSESVCWTGRLALAADEDAHTLVVSFTCLEWVKSAQNLHCWQLYCEL